MNKQLHILSIEHLYERVALRILFGFLIIAIAAYLYFVGATVLHIIARKEALREVSALQSSLALAEREYFALSESASPSHGGALGLSPVEDTAYVYRPGSTARASTDTIDTNAL
jgi:hypothetical protein